MKKRRVLAILLALSLVVSGNGMTVLAAETGVEQSVVTMQEEPTGTGEEAEETETPGTTEGAEESETPGVTQDPEETETPETTENPEKQENPDTPKEDEAEEQPVEDEVADPEEEQPVEDEVADPAEEQEKADEAEKMLQNYVCRMVTFTDDTGMKVTYDANASTLYDYVIVNGVLTQVKDKATGEEASFTGNVELKQPEEEEQQQYTSIAASVFSQNTDITYVKLPSGVETITEGAFKGCTALKGVYLPASVNKIENSAFENCTAMTQISVPKAVTSIGDKAFKGDAKLHLVHIKDSDYCNLTTIGKSAFEGCATLAEFCSDTGFVVPVNLRTINESAFKGCKAIKKVDFTDTELSSLGESAFQGCTGLADLNMGDRISEIPQNAFADCSGLMSLIIQDGESMVIDSYAFQGCFKLKQLILPQTVSEVQDYAFQGCTNLGRVEVHNFTMKFGENEAFPSEKLATGAKRLFIVDAPRSNKISSGQMYAAARTDVADYEYFNPEGSPLYGCVIEGEDPQKKDGVITGGKIWVEDAEGTPFNNLNNGKGVPSDNKRYYIKYMEKSDFVFVSESLRCNGEPVQRDDKTKSYYFTMPVGGVIITAEFAPKETGKITGKSVTVEFSNGEPTDRGVTLKVGQTTRMFLLDENGEAIPSSKITFSIPTSDSKVATVNKNGVITAIGTNGKAAAEAEITATVTAEDGKPVPIARKIIVLDAEADSIALKATMYPSQIVTIEQSEETSIQTASVEKSYVSKSGVEITLKANVYTAEQENISKELTWTTSNAKVAKLTTAKTDGKNPINVVQIQKGCEGEATITATATNPTDGANKKVTQKFVVRVYEKTFKLATTSVTVNPNALTGSEIEVIGSYGQDVSDASIQLYREEKDSKTKQTMLIEDTNFVVRPQETIGKVSAKKFSIEANSRTTIAQKTYNLKVSINGNRETLFPLTITVKRSAPNPTVKFNTNKAKFNLWYKDGGTTAEGDQMSLLTEITKLGDVKVSRAVLEPLSQKDDDILFTENFVIDREATDLENGKVVIKRSAAALQYTKQKKAAVTGNLIIYFDGYDDSAAKKVKVTMPTCTTTPSWALRTAKGAYRADVRTPQNVSLELYDKKSKTKEQVVLDETYRVTAEDTGDVGFTETPSIENNAIEVRFWPGKGTVKLVLHNPAWDQDQNGNERVLSYTYTVSVSSAKPTVKTDQSAVSLNLNYPEKAAQFTLVSNLSGLEIDPDQTFTPVVTKANAAEIAKLKVTYENGEGSVGIMSEDESREPNTPIKKGTYKFECIPKADVQDLKKVVLTVKVLDAKPSVKFGKGNLQLNTVVYENNNNRTNSQSDDPESEEEQQTILYQETSERTFKVNGQPEGYALAPVGDADDNEKTTIVCTTKNKPGAESYFNFEVEEDPAHEEDDVLTVSLKDRALTPGTYNFKMTPRFLMDGRQTVSAQPVTFQVKVISKSDIYLATSAKGKINLVNREGEAGDKNGIVYTPALKNIVGEIEEVKIYDNLLLEEESNYFDICMIEEGKDAGKLFVTPKKIAETPQNSGDPIEYTYAELDNNKNYYVFIWAKVKGYAGDARSKGGVVSKRILIKTTQVLPKVTLSRSSMDVYLSTKNYDAEFVVKPKEGSVGTIEEIYFGEKDEMANDSFTLDTTPQADGSMKVTVHLKEAVSFANGTTNNVKFYVKYKGQGENTSKTATGFTMKIKVN